MIRIECDGCYTNIKEEMINKLGEVTTYSLEIGTSTALSKRVKTIHLCKKCTTNRKSLYLDNPLYVEPPEDATSEQKASQSS